MTLSLWLGRNEWKVSCTAFECKSSRRFQHDGISEIFQWFEKWSKITEIRHSLKFHKYYGFDSACKESTCNAGDLGLIPVSERSPGEGKGYPLQCSGLENSMDCIVHGVTKSQTRLSDFHFQASYSTIAIGAHLQKDVPCKEKKKNFS